MASSLKRCTLLRSGGKTAHCTFTSLTVPLAQRPPPKSLQSRNSRVTASEVATAADVGQDAGHNQSIPHTPVLLSEVLGAFSAVNLKVRSPGGCLLPAHAPETDDRNYADLR